MRNIKKKILEESAQNITEKEIYVKVFRKSIPNLTLKNLPGIISENDSFNTFEKMYIKHLKGVHVTILLVLIATIDLNTSHQIEIMKNLKTIQIEQYL